MWRMPDSEKEALRRINSGPFRATELAKYFGYTDFSCDACKALRHGLFVVPGETSWSCLRCMWCCRNTPQFQIPLELPKKPNGECSYLNEELQGCTVQGQKHLVCKKFPFNTIKDDEKHPQPLLLIDKRCLGVNRGEGVIDDEIYNDLVIMVLANNQVQEAFNAGCGENGCSDSSIVRQVA